MNRRVPEGVLNNVTNSLRRAFSLIELLLVIAIVAILAALLLPAVSKSYARGKRAKCISNLKQVGLAFHTFAHDHQDKLPAQVSTNSGGTLEFVARGPDYAFKHLQALSNELSDPKLLVCPADSRLPAETFLALRNENVSYFVAPAGEFGNSDSALAGDRNIVGLWPSGTAAPTWTHELHDGQGNILFGDSRVELFNGLGLQKVIAGGKTPVPIILPGAPSTPSGPGGGSAPPAGGVTPGNGGTANGPTVGNNGHGSGSPASFRQPGGSGGAQSFVGAPRGAAPSGSSPAGASGGNAGGALNRLEKLFEGPPDRPKSSAQPNSFAPAAAPAPSSASPREGTLEITSPAAMVSQAERDKASLTNIAKSTPLEAASEDPSPVGFGQFVGKISPRNTWWLLLLLLATLIAFELLRRKRTRRNRES